jgi:NADH dehydrogenase
MEKAPDADSVRPGGNRVVVVGGGFAGLALARTLGDSPMQVILVDRRNHHLFQPLLYQVATAALSPADIAEPIRKILRRYRNVTVLMDEVVGIDARAQTAQLAGGLTLPFDALAVATGSAYTYFGHEDWASLAPGLKAIENARSLRGQLLRSFELAELSTDERDREALLTTIVVGGGPTGVEMAGAIAELGRWSLRGEFRRIDPSRVRVLLVEAGERILPQFPETLAHYAVEQLQRLGVTVWTRRRVTSLAPSGATIDGQFIPCSTRIWAAGVIAAPAASWFAAVPRSNGQLSVDSFLRVRGLDRVYALGDLAYLEQDGVALPGLAQVAKQQGEYLGRALLRSYEGGNVEPFRFKNRGNTAVIGRHAAVFDFGRWSIKGRLAWILWALVHVYLLVSFEKRLLVSFQWIWRYVTRSRGARLIP